jgi:hypothetical protein
VISRLFALAAPLTGNGLDTATDGGTSSFCNTSYGDDSRDSGPLSTTWSGRQATPTGGGYWLVGTDAAA